MQARILKPTRNTMQSVNHKSVWILEFPNVQDRFTEQFIGRTASQDMMNEVRIEFSSQKEAIDFAKTNNYDYEIVEHKEIKFKKKSYADNFK